MIKIEIVSTDSDPIQTYRITINDKFVTTFRHNPNHGIARCLTCAAAKIDTIGDPDEV